MQAGYAKADITPEPGLTLSGFVARRNQPSIGADDPIFVHALAIEEDGKTILLLVFDLLGLGSEITAEIHEALDQLMNGEIPRSSRILCCTHNHSAPATIKLLGCGVADRDYWDQVIRAATLAAGAALSKMQAARLRYTVVLLPGCNYNRRQVLMDGRVVMTQFPDVPVRKRGPTWDQMFLARLEAEDGVGIVGIAHWAAHPCTICGLRISADYPGELCRQLSHRYQLPFLFLQGACGNLNPHFSKMTREEMLHNVDTIMRTMKEGSWPDPVPTTPSRLVDKQLPLHYGPIPTVQELEGIRDGMESIAKTASGPQQLLAMLSNILNVEPGKDAEPELLRYIASVLNQWSAELIETYDKSRQGECNLSIKVWRLGQVVFCFVAGEVFVETATTIRGAFPGMTVNIVGYSGPLVGYLPTDEALDEGGYEVDYAYRFYGHPAAFAKGSEPALVKALKDAVQSLSSS